MTTLRFVVRCALLAASALPSPVRAQSRFVIKKGKDTVAVEMFKRDGTTLTSDIFQINGRAGSTRLVCDLIALS